MESALCAIWGKLQGYRVTEISHNKFQFFFEEEMDLMRIEKGSPWLFKDFVLHTRRWSSESGNEKHSFNTYSVWVQFWGLPDFRKTMKVARKLGDMVGRVSETQNSTPSKKTKLEKPGLYFKEKGKDKENNSNPKVAHQGDSEEAGLSITSAVINQVQNNSTRIPMAEIDKSTTG
ncbi:hypothetical protein PIB30_068682 [Stylosanthes scabra]|uniref:DUF4283 domain-containing protein n=1 Tax=Stylosanthes scabra TaxID=79078 RepID=A0ABU6WMQ1_9FABA|nr:hypothetical protein [Stylosanthes scabra]